MSNPEKLNERLIRLRKQRGLTARDMAYAIEVPESTYREWEYGRGMKLPPCQKISQVLGVSVSELITGETPELQWILDELLKMEKNAHELRINLSSLL